MARMTECPDEVLDAIASYVAVPSLTRESNLCSLYLASRRLYRIATRELYRDIAFAFSDSPPIDRSHYRSRWLTYDRFLLFLQSLKETPTLGLLVRSARILVHDRSDMPRDGNLVLISMGGQPQHNDEEDALMAADDADATKEPSNPKASAKTTNIKDFLGMIPLVRDLHIDCENYFGHDEHILDGHSFSCLETLKFRAPGASLDSASYLFWIPTLKTLTLEDVTLGEHSLKVPDSHVRSSIKTFRLGYVPVEDKLPAVLKRLPDLESFQFSGRYATIEEVIDGLSPAHKLLQRLDLAAFDMGGRSRVSLGDFSRLIQLTLPDSLLVPYEDIISGRPPLLTIETWPPKLRQLQIVYHHRQPFIDHPPKRPIEGTPFEREIEMMLDLINLKSTQLPDLERICIQHPRHVDFARRAWKPPPAVLDALSASGVKLKNELPVTK